MLSRHVNQTFKPRHALCNCSLISTQGTGTEEGDIIISHHREITELSIKGREKRDSARKYSFKRPKTSLRGSRVGREKENSSGNVTPEEYQKYSSSRQATELFNSLSNSREGPFADLKNTGVNTRKTSIFCPKNDHAIEYKQLTNGRYIKQVEICDNEQISRQTIPKEQVIQDCPILGYSSSEALKLSEISIQAQFDRVLLDKKLYTQDYILHEKPVQYFSQQEMTSQQDSFNDYSEQISSIALKKKTTKVFHRIQQLKFKSTESIGDSDEGHVSEVVTEFDDSFFDQSISSNTSEKTEMKQVPKAKRLTAFLKQRYSRVEEMQTH